MSIQEFKESKSEKRTFWHHATKYAAAVKEDEPFVNEMAYLMVTLHRTGA